MLFHIHLLVTDRVLATHLPLTSPAIYQTSQFRPNTKMGGGCNAERSIDSLEYLAIGQGAVGLDFQAVLALSTYSQSDSHS